MAMECEIPLLGRLRIVKDPLGVGCLSFIVAYFLYGVGSVGCVYLPLYLESRIPMPVVLWFICSALLTITSLWKAVSTNPGRVCLPVQEQTSAEAYCEVCRREKPPDSHHCRRCNQCVLNMDHHCPWINNCVGEANRHAFILLIFYTFVQCVTSLALAVAYLSFITPCSTCDKESFCVAHGGALMKVATGLAGFMACSSCGLVGSQHITLILNTTTIQFMQMQRQWMQTGSWDRSFIARRRPCMAAYRDVCGPIPIWLWPFPCFKRSTHYNYDTQLSSV